MRTYSQEEIDERADELAEKFMHRGKPDLVIEGPALIALADFVINPTATDEDIDDAVREARAAGCTWDEITPVLHFARPVVPSR